MRGKLLQKSRTIVSKKRKKLQEYHRKKNRKITKKSKIIKEIKENH